MEKEVFIKYVKALSRYEKLSKEEFSIYSNTEEVHAITELRKLVEENSDLMNLLKKIHKSPDDKRIEIVNEYFSKDEKESTEEYSTKTVKYDVINSVLYVAIATTIILLICLIYYVLKYYA
ncbi:MAG: hypothetical protein IJI58_03340 [Bacilli bacterium]|nr:hypothetical protein [Bacilli bacterium]